MLTQSGDILIFPFSVNKYWRLIGKDFIFTYVKILTLLAPSANWVFSRVQIERKMFVEQILSTNEI